MAVYEERGGSYHLVEDSGIVRLKCEQVAIGFDLETKVAYKHGNFSDVLDWRQAKHGLFKLAILVFPVGFPAGEINRCLTDPSHLWGFYWRFWKMHGLPEVFMVLCHSEGQTICAQCPISLVEMQAFRPFRTSESAPVA